MCCLFQGRQAGLILPLPPDAQHHHPGRGNSRPARPRAGPRSPHLLDVLGALVVDEDDNGVDVHVVQPLDGMGGDVQQTVPVLRGAAESKRRGQAWGPGLGNTAALLGTLPLSLPPMGPTCPLTGASSLHK